MNSSSWNVNVFFALTIIRFLESTVILTAKAITAMERHMGYELHVVHTDSWLTSSRKPITRAQVAAVIQADPELSWSKTDHLNGNYDFIEWNGQSLFYWEKDQIIGKNLLEPQILKLSKIAQTLGAKLFGDEDEQYIYRKSFFGREHVKVITYQNK